MNEIQRFLLKIKITGNCWDWTGAIMRDGYGHFRANGKTVRVHRFIYEYFYGKINSKLDLDHLCRNRACVNPLHLREMTRRENVLTGNGLTAINSRKQFCKKGHEFSEENTYRHKNGNRRCRICTLNENKQWRNNKMQILRSFV